MLPCTAFLSAVAITCSDLSRYIHTFPSTHWIWPPQVTTAWSWHQRLQRLPAHEHSKFKECGRGCTKIIEKWMLYCFNDSNDRIYLVIIISFCSYAWRRIFVYKTQIYLSCNIKKYKKWLHKNGEKSAKYKSLSRRQWKTKRAYFSIQYRYQSM